MTVGLVNLNGTDANDAPVLLRQLSSDGTVTGLRTPLTGLVDSGQNLIDPATHEDVQDVVAALGATLAVADASAEAHLAAIITALGATLAVQSVAGSSVLNNQQTATASAVALPGNVLKNGVIVQALSTNTGTIYVGGSGVTAGNGYPLAAGQQVPLNVANTNLIYMLGTNTSDKIAWIGN